MSAYRTRYGFYPEVPIRSGVLRILHTESTTRAKPSIVEIDGIPRHLRSQAPDGYSMDWDLEARRLDSSTGCSSSGSRSVSKGIRVCRSSTHRGQNQWWHLLHSCFKPGLPDPQPYPLHWDLLTFFATSREDGIAEIANSPKLGSRA